MSVEGFVTQFPWNVSLRGLSLQAILQQRQQQHGCADILWGGSIQGYPYDLIPLTSSALRMPSEPAVGEGREVDGADGAFTKGAKRSRSPQR